MIRYRIVIRIIHIWTMLSVLIYDIYIYKLSIICSRVVVVVIVCVWALLWLSVLPLLPWLPVFSELPTLASLLSPIAVPSSIVPVPVVSTVIVSLIIIPTSSVTSLSPVLVTASVWVPSSWLVIACNHLLSRSLRVFLWSEIFPSLLSACASPFFSSLHITRIQINSNDSTS